MLHLIYIGRYEKTIKRFSKLPKEEFYNVATCDKAIKIIDKIREKFDIIILYEQTNTQTDIKDIESLQEKVSRYLYGISDGFTYTTRKSAISEGQVSTTPYHLKAPRRQ